MYPLHTLFLVAAWLMLTSCAHLAPMPERRVPELTLPPGTSTYFDRKLAPLEQQHAGKSAFRLVSDGYEAFALRRESAARAQRSIDVQAYIWHADITGAVLAHTLLQAADRGVKVRLLVDDMDSREKHYAFAAIADHPNISVRVFNPFASREGLFSKVSEVLWRFEALNRRMHNKTWIVDNRLAVAGGRNIGDEYFGAGQVVNFMDLDLAMIGPVVRDVSASFDRYWNSRVSYPIKLLAPQGGNRASLQTLRGDLNRLVLEDNARRFQQTLRTDPLVAELAVGRWTMDWTDEYEFVSDDPLKALGKQSGRFGSHVLAKLRPQVLAAQDSVWILSPYFVPGARGTETLAGLARRGVEIRLVTNSLAASDVIAVHSGYRPYREPLMQSGVRIWEIKPLHREKRRASLFGSSGASLHSKALVLDGKKVFVGSYNLDQRSTSINTEQGVLVHSAFVGRQLQAFYSRLTTGEYAWQLELRKGELYWKDDAVQVNSEPDAGAWRTVLSRVIEWFPVEQQL